MRRFARWLMISTTVPVTRRQNIDLYEKWHRLLSFLYNYSGFLTA